MLNSLTTFYKSLTRDLKVIFARSSIANFAVNINPYNSIYIIALGATGTQLGLFTSLSLGLTAVAAMLTGWLSDRLDRKHMFLIGAAVGVLVPLTYLTAGSLYWLIPAFVFAGFADGIISPAWTAMYANSIRNKQRGTVYGLATTIILAPMLFAGLIGGGIVSASGGLTVTGIRPVYAVQAVLLASAWLLVWRLLSNRKPTQPKRKLNAKTMVSDYGTVLAKKGVKSWVLMKSLGSLSIGLAGPFWMVYAAAIHGATAMTIAYMVTARTLTQIATSPFAGRLTDRIGRKKLIIGGRIIMYAATILFLLLGRSPAALILAWVLMGLADSTGVAWQAQEAELVNHNQRARMTALSVAAFNALAVPASILGGWLWDTVGHMAPFIVMAVIDGLVRMPIVYAYVPEGKTLEQEPDPEEASL
ncbi:MFS transporter [Candidatus Bathyarchaeota archaeon]|nr:MFS transporter [Candidatus Bathyarchaeota archaeon]